MKFAALILLLSSAQAWACSCIGNGTACDMLRGTEIVFLGRVTEDSGEGLGTGPGKMVVEEIFHGLPKETREVTVETSAHSSCYMRLKRDERYVIYGSKGEGGKIRRNDCSFSFRVTGNEALLSALRQVERGGPQRLVGSVWMKSAGNVRSEAASGVPVTATMGRVRLEATTNAQGEFDFLNVQPGTYHLAVSSTEFYEDKWRWPDKDPAVTASTCGYQNLYVWPNGRVEGKVRDTAGQPAANVPVQAFIKDWRGELDSGPLREAATDAEGAYVLTGIPPGDVVIGVNGARYSDKLAWAPTFYGGTSERDRAERVHLTKGQRLTGIDLKLPAPRRKATLQVDLVFADGSAAKGAGVTWENTAGVQRGHACGVGSDASVVTMPVFVGETYVVKGFLFRGLLSWAGSVGPILVEGADQRVRVTLLEKKD